MSKTVKRKTASKKKANNGSSNSSKTNPKGAAARRPHLTLGHPTIISSSNPHADMARRKIWMSEDGRKYNYENLSDQHLNNIHNMLQSGKGKTRQAHKQGIHQEKLRRETLAGKVLYDNGEKKKSSKD